ncbi:MAG TPA: enoyl-CoA hydratase-related protein, partial [Hyphomonas sp.]|nr:enoyl-CoA hydratase-related protein [Hyphomonas sp.]
MTYKTITFEHSDRVALVTINRPESLNALNQEVMAEVAHVFGEIDRNKDIAVSVLTGEGRAFAAGADIKEMQPQTFSDMYVDDF